MSSTDEPKSVPLSGAIISPYWVRLIEACRDALARLEAKAGPGHNIFAETGEVLFWLYAIGDEPGGNRLHAGFQWARHQYAHGNLIADVYWTEWGAMPGTFIPGRTMPGSLPVCRWLPCDRIARYAKARRLTELRRDYETRLVGQPVLATLRDELGRLTVFALES
jgi:hypothetical protein